MLRFMQGSPPLAETRAREPIPAAADRAGDWGGASVCLIQNHPGRQEELGKLHKLFPRLVNCPNGETLSDKPGNMLSSLA